jgi:hypothetical protein
MQRTPSIRCSSVARLTPIRGLLLLCALGISCQKETSSSDKPSELCAQPIPNSNQLLFEFRYDSEWATTSELWGYAINDIASQVGKKDLGQLPRGRVYEIAADGTVRLASFAAYDPKIGERTIRHVVRGVPVIETVFNSDGNGWARGTDYLFEGIEAAGDRIAFTGVKDRAGNLVSDHLEVDAGGMVARDKGGVIQAIELYRVEPSPASSAAGTKRRFFYDTYAPVEGRAIRVEELPARGICRRVK